MSDPRSIQRGANPPGAWDKFILAAICAAVLAHVAAMYVAPRLELRRAMDALSDGGMQFNHWVVMDRFAEPVAETLWPSPDVMTAACVYDVSPGPVAIAPAAWDGYWSLTLYDDKGDPYSSLSDRELRNHARIILVRAGERQPPREEMIVESPSARGMAVLRRLAPTPARHAAALRVAHGDVCGNLAALRR